MLRLRSAGLRRRNLDSEKKPEAALAVAVAPLAAARYDVFLCHNSLDKPLVKDVADALQIEAGILFFLDEFSIPPSVEFLEFIRQEMRKSAACAIFVGANGWGNTHLVEARLALEVKAERADFRIIPINLPDAPAAAWSDLFGAGNQPPFNWIKLEGPTDDAARAKLIEAVHGRFPVRAAGPEAITPYYIRRQAALWELSNRKDNSFLIGGQLLKTARAQAATNPQFVSVNSVPAYLDRCAQRERNRLRAFAGAAASVSVVTAILAGMAILQRNEAGRQRDAATESARIAQARSLTSLASRSIGEDRADERALLLARQAYLLDKRTGGKSSYDVIAALSEVLGTPFVGSIARVPQGRTFDRISASGSYALLSGKKNVLFGPLLGGDAKQGTALEVELGDPVAGFVGKGDDLIVVTSKGGVEIRKLAAPEQRRRLIGELGQVPSIFIVTRDGGAAVAVLGERELVRIDVAAAKVSKSWKVDSFIESIAVSADGRLIATTDKEGKLRAYAEGLSRPVATFPANDRVNSFEFASGTTLIVGERGGRIWGWDPKNKPSSRREFEQAEVRGSVDSIAVSDDGQTAATASGAISPGILIWDLGSRAQKGRIPGVRSVARLAFTGDGKFLVSSGMADPEVKFWRMKGSGSGRSIVARDWQPFPIPGRLYSVARHPTQDEFTVGGDHGVLQRWSAQLESPPVVLAERRRLAMQSVPNLSRFESSSRNFLLTGHVMAVSFSQNGKRFATVDPYGYALVWTANDAKPPVLVQSADVSHPSLSVALSPSGHRLVVGATSRLTVMHDLNEDGAATQKIALASEGDHTVRAIAFVDEDTLLVGDDFGRLARWRIQGTTPTSEALIGGGPPIVSMALVDPTRVVVGRGAEVEIISLNERTPTQRSISKDLGQVYATAVSDDRRMLAAGFGDGIVRLWSLDRPERQPVLLNLHKDVVRSLAFDKAGSRIVSVSDDGTIRSTVISADRLAGIVCELVWRDLNQSEISSFFTKTTPPMLPSCP